MIEENAERMGELAAEIEEREQRYVPLERQPPRSTQPQRSISVSEQDWSGWDRWCKQHVQNGLDSLAEVVGAEVAKIERGLTERITALEVELAILRSGEAKGEVYTLPNWRRKEHAA